MHHNLVLYEALYYEGRHGNPMFGFTGTRLKNYMRLADVLCDVLCRGIVSGACEQLSDKQIYVKRSLF